MHLTDAAREAEAVFAGQVQVNQKHISSSAPSLVFEFFGTIERDHPVAFVAQRVGGEFTQVVVVFNEDDAQVGSHSSKQMWVSVGW